MDTTRPVLVFLCLAAVIQSTTCWTVQEETHLRGNLTVGYQTSVRPSDTVLVDIAFQLTGLVNVDIKSQKFAVAGNWVMVWTDSRLTWNKAQYGDVDVLYYFEDDLWTPALVVTNSNNDLSAIDEDSIPLRVWDNGLVEWTPPCIVTVGCEMDATYFPFDSQTCHLEVTSTGYRTDELGVESTRGFLFDYYSEDGDWTVLGSSSGAENFTEHGNTYTRLTFSISLKRRNAYHWINVIIPVIVSGILSNFVFMLPVDSGEKIGYALTCMLSFVMLLTMVAADMPTSAKHTALLEVYITVVLFLGGFAVMESVVTINLYMRDEDEKIPKWMVKATQIGMTLCRTNQKPSEKKVHPQDNKLPMAYQKPSQGDKTPIRRLSLSSSTTSLDDDDITWKTVSRTLDGVSLRVFWPMVTLFTFIFLIVMGTN